MPKKDPPEKKATKISRYAERSVVSGSYVKKETARKKPATVVKQSSKKPSGRKK